MEWSTFKQIMLFENDDTIQQRLCIYDCIVGGIDYTIDFRYVAGIELPYPK